jgi:hypothetical protein
MLNEKVGKLFLNTRQRNIESENTKNSFFAEKGEENNNLFVISNLVFARVADPHHFNADTDPAFHFNADPDLDPAPLQSDGNL